MRVGARSENPLEWLLNAAGAVPTPLIDTLQAMLRARAIMAGCRLGLFNALRDGPAEAAAVARQLGTDPAATEKLLGALVGAGYLRFRAGRYALTRVARQWLLPDAPCSLHDNMLHRYLEWEAIGHLEEFARTGKPLDIHERLSPEQWQVYQRGMRSVAGLSAPEVARRLPLPAGARRMLDLGGSHGYYSVALCRRHPGLTAAILDLPEAIACAAPLLARENMGDRVVHQPGDARTADLGRGEWDLVFTAQLLHHLDARTNQNLMSRIAQALRPGGMVAVVEVLRPASPDAVGQTGLLLDLLFAVASPSGSWPAEAITGWQQQAGLRPQPPIWLRYLPGAAIIAAVRDG